MKIFTIGHKSPDLDAIASAYSYAEFLRKHKRYANTDIVPLRAGEPNKETEFVFKKAKAEIPLFIEEVELDEKDAFILCDHNELAQRHELVKPEQVIEIVDHHKINIDFAAPVRIDVKPLGSTSSLVYEHFEMYGVEPSEQTLMLVLCSILSDTQGLKASTTTGYDSVTAHNIAEKLNLDIDKVTFEIFRAKSDIQGLSVQQIARKDYKVFDFSGKKVFINQVETVEPDKILDQKDEMVKVLDEVKAQEGAGQAYVVVTDILKVNSHIIYSTEEEKRIVEKAFTTVGSNNIADIGPRMSRKKDIAPEIERAILEN